MKIDQERRDSINATKTEDVDGLQQILDACTLCERQNTPDCDQEIFKKQQAMNDYGLVPGVSDTPI